MSLSYPATRYYEPLTPETLRWFLKMGWDTLDIANWHGLIEASVYNILAKTEQARAA